MELAAARVGGGPLSQRKEWRAISDHSFHPSTIEKTEQQKLCQSDERTIYEEGSLGFCSVDTGGGLSENLLGQRIHDVSRKREELQHMEIELMAQAMAQAEILDVHTSFESRIKEHSEISARLKDQLQERELRMHELELKLGEKDRELHSLKMDNETAWAKEEATFRRERDNSETERAQHLQQIHELQEHIREKENEFLNLEEQHRVAQETLLYKDEQLREAQAWVVHSQEMSALQSTANHSLQAELRQRIEQFNQYCIALQRQFVDMEQHHIQTIQQLQLELVELKERHGLYEEGSQGCLSSLSSLGSKGNLINSNDNGSSNGNSEFLTNGNLNAASPFVSSPNPSVMAERVPGLPLIQLPIVGMNSGYLPHGQMPPLHSYVLQPQSPANSSSPQSQVCHIQPMPVMSAHQHWQNQQVISEISVLPMDVQTHLSQTEQNILRSDASSRYDIAAERQVIYPDHDCANFVKQQLSVLAMNGTSDVVQHQEAQEPSTNTPFMEKSGFDVQSQKSNVKVHGDAGVCTSKVTSLSLVQLTSSAQSNSAACNNTAECNRNVSKSAEVPLPFRVTNSLVPVKTSEPVPLDERSLLACIVRAIPAGSGSGIRISTTLPNRLAKMLAPYHWHDYKKHHGELDDFVAQHPELFVVDGDIIHLREGAQEIISATTAVAKVAAAAASSVQYSSFLPSVAVTPIAHGSRLKKATSHGQLVENPISNTNGLAAPVSGDHIGMHPQISNMQEQQPNGVNYRILQGISNIKILSKPKEPQDLSSFSTDTRPDLLLNDTVGNGAKLDRSGLLPSGKSSRGRQGFGGKRSSGCESFSKR